MDYFVYCIKCQKKVTDPSQPCPMCNSANDMVDWVEPEEDCTLLSNGQDCIERGWDSDDLICEACTNWLKWDNIRRNIES